MVTAVRVMILAGGAALALLIAWAMITGDFAAAGQFLTRDPWGLVTLGDLYLGFALMAVVIYASETRKSVAALFILPLFVLGNVVAAVWLAYRLQRLLRP